MERLWVTNGGTSANILNIQSPTETRCSPQAWGLSVGITTLHLMKILCQKTFNKVSETNILLGTTTAMFEGHENNRNDIWRSR
jgi:hypothetical protein